MNTKNKLLFLSASERWNLGDLLFPVVFKHYADAAGQAFTNVGMTQYDSDDADIVPVEDIAGHLDSSDISLVVGGGEVLGANLANLALFLHDDQDLRKDFRRSLDALETLTPSEGAPNKARALLLNMAKRRVAKKMQPRFGLPSSEMLPFYAAVLPQSRRFYLPVGGRFPNSSHPVLRQSEGNTVAVAGRDRRTAASFPEHMQAALVPDPVSTIDRVFPDPSAKVKRVVIQLSMHKLALGLDRLQHLLDQFIDRGYEVVGLAIGRCPGHHDQSSLEELARRVPRMHTSFSSSVREAVNLLAESEVYMGTSLHGAILSHAYGNAVLAMDEMVPKLDDYLNTWMGDHAFHVTRQSEDKAIFQFVSQFQAHLAKENASELASKSECYIKGVLEQA